MASVNSLVAPNTARVCVMRARAAVYSIGQLPRVLVTYGFENTGGAGTHAGHTGSKTPGGNSVPGIYPGTQCSRYTNLRNVIPSKPGRPRCANRTLRYTVSENAVRKLHNGKDDHRSSEIRRASLLRDRYPITLTLRPDLATSFVTSIHNRLNLDWTCRQPDRTQVHVSSARSVRTA